MLNFPSWTYVAVVAIGGFLVVMGNIGYPVAREREKKAQLANDAWSILLPELTDNRKIAADTITDLDNNQVNFTKLKASSWEAVSKGAMLLSFNSRDMLRLMRAYDKVYHINELNAEYIDYGVGMKSALSSRVETMSSIRNGLRLGRIELGQDIDTIKSSHIQYLLFGDTGGDTVGYGDTLLNPQTLANGPAATSDREGGSAEWATPSIWGLSKASPIITVSPIISCLTKTEIRLGWAHERF